jgi:hypothetical protein
MMEVRMGGDEEAVRRWWKWLQARRGKRRVDKVWEKLFNGTCSLWRLSWAASGNAATASGALKNRRKKPLVRCHWLVTCLIRRSWCTRKKRKGGGEEKAIMRVGL